MAVDDMMAELGSAANYKANRGDSGSRTAARRARDAVRRRSAADRASPARAARRLSMSFDRAANSMYNHGFPRAVRGKNEHRVRFSMYAVIKTGGKQYKVAVGEKLKVEQIPADIDAEITLDQVLAVGEGESIKFGTPLVSGASVKATVVSQGRHAKVTIFKMRRRKHYQKHGGHRQNYTELRIDAINA
ncbi:large subunit ribosomal protein L21 [Paraburkholderia phenoliruptrix]|nr:large subunit ribosomal protein L21 [Paraburkholderia phenoliruptrix]